jgi:hypothetical protein
MRSRRHAWLCVCGLLLGAVCGGAQAPGQIAIVPAVSPATEAALHDMARLAGVIFTGEVVAVRRHDAGDGSTGVVEIEFAVDDAVRGVRVGSYTLREWAGLWNAGDEPFRVGQRYLMLLHAPGESGLSSPVDGVDGAIPIRGGGTVDLRWIAARAALGQRPAFDATTAASAASPQHAPYATVVALLRSWERDDAAAR